MAVIPARPRAAGQIDEAVAPVPRLLVFRGARVSQSRLDSSIDFCQFSGLMSSPSSHPNDPLHGITLETVLRRMVDKHGWERLADQIEIRCFMFDPTIKSSLTFLRKTPWARKKLEDWYVYDVTRGWIDGRN